MLAARRPGAAYQYLLCITTNETDNVRVQTYLSSPLQNVSGYVAAVTVGSIGAAEMTSAAGIVLGTIMVAVAAGLFINQVKARLVADNRGLTYSNLFRTNTIGWADVHDVEACSGSSLGPWYSPGINTRAQTLRINSVLGSRGHIEQVVAAIQAARPAIPDSSARPT